MRLQAIRRRSDGTYQLTFDSHGVTHEVVTDLVVLTLPFAVLRTLDFHQAGFDALKTHAIEHLGRGHNGKPNIFLRSVRRVAARHRRVACATRRQISGLAAGKSPAGTPDNSPAIHRWESVAQNRPSPAGAQEILPKEVSCSFVPDGTRSHPAPKSQR